MERLKNGRDRSPPTLAFRHSPAALADRNRARGASCHCVRTDERTGNGDHEVASPPHVDRRYDPCHHCPAALLAHPDQGSCPANLTIGAVCEDLHSRLPIRHDSCRLDNGVAGLSTDAFHASSTAFRRLACATSTIRQRIIGKGFRLGPCKARLDIAWTYRRSCPGCFGAFRSVSGWRYARHVCWAIGYCFEGIESVADDR